MRRWMNIYTLGIYVYLALCAAALAQPVNQPPSTISCNATAQYAASTSGLTKIITGVAGKVVYICGYTIHGGAAVNVGLSSGTGTNCATGTAALTPQYVLASGTDITDSSSLFRGLQVPAATDLCINSSGAAAATAIVYYGQY
jgi:hypothetical protein